MENNMSSLFYSYTFIHYSSFIKNSLLFVVPVSFPNKFGRDFRVEFHSFLKVTPKIKECILHLVTKR